MSELHPQPISRETADYAAIEAAGGAEAALDKKGNQYLFTDDATEANAHYAAEEGKWEKFAQPGFEDSAKTIAQQAQIETAHDDAIHEDTERWMASQNQKEYENTVPDVSSEEDADKLINPVSGEDWHEEEQIEDPLAGDVDKFVHPDETADPGLAWGNHAHAARQHGDLTES